MAAIKMAHAAHAGIKQQEDGERANLLP